MVFGRIRRRGPERPRDPLDGFVLSHVAVVEASPDPNYGISPSKPKWSPPPEATTFASLGREAAERAAKAKAHVVVREDPMFGRRGYVKEVIDDAENGFLILVVVFAVRKTIREPWKEYHNAPPDARRYWSPGKVELA